MIRPVGKRDALPDGGGAILSARRIKQRAYYVATSVVVSLAVALVGQAALAPAVSQFGDAGDFVAQSWQVEDGLPQGSVLAFAQTRDGDLWFGTQNGLVRFDGLTLKVFERRAHPRLRSNFVRALVEEAPGVLWVGTSRGLARIREGAFEPIDSTPRALEWNVTALAKDSQGIWIGTTRGLARLVGKALMWQLPGDGRPGTRINALQVAPDGTLWAGTNDGLRRFAPDGATRTYTRREGLPHQRVTALAVDPSGALWAGCTQGPPVRLDRGGRRFSPVASDWPAQDIRSLLFDRAGHAWIGSRTGLARLANGRLSVWRAGSGLTDDHVLALFQDEEDSLWIGTERAGLNRFKRPRMTTITARDGLPEDTVLTVLEDAAGAMWLGTWRGLTRRAPDGSTRTFTRADGLAPGAVIALTESRDGGLWVGSMDGGVSKLSGGRVTPLPLPVEGVPVLALHEDTAGRLWIATNDGLYAFHQGAFKRYGHQDGLPADTVYCLVPARAGGLWVGTRHGLARLHDGRIAYAQPFRDALADSIMTVHEDSQGTLWLGTYGGGLGRLSDGKLTTYTEKDGLPDNTVYALLDDGGDGLWLGSNRGPARLSRAQLEAFAAGTVRQLTPQTFGRGDGLRSIECSGGSQPVGWRARDGRLWFATVGGAVIFDPKLPPALPKPQAKLTQVKLDRQPLEIGAGEAAPPAASRGDLEFHFSAGTLAAPEKVRFRYRLDGFDDDWHEVGSQRVATYTNVPPGRYRFEVQAAGDEARWGDHTARFELTLRPQYHQTAWFKGLPVLVPVLVLVLAGWGFHQRRMRRLETEAAVLAERHRLACELHDGLAQGLGGLVRQIEAARAELGDTSPDLSERLLRARNLARTSLVDARRSVRALRPPELDGSCLAEGLTAAAQALVAGTGVRLELKVSGTPYALPADAEQHLFRTGQEALSNAVRHAHASVIRLSIVFRRRSVRVTVSDDGCGLGSRAPVETGGLGLGGMRERMRLAGGRLHVVSRPGRGTEVAATVPVGAFTPREVNVT